MKFYNSFLVTTIFILITGCNEPSNYDDCILKYVKEDMNERAVNAVINSCYNKFSDQEGETDADTEISNKEIDNEAAIGRVKKAHSIGTYLNNENYIKNELEDIVGALEIIGWQSQKINDQTFLVTYKYKLNNRTKGFAFEFNTKADIIRHVILPPTNEELELLEQ